MAHQLPVNGNNNGGQQVAAAFGSPLPFQIPLDPRYINPQTQRVQLRVSKVGKSGDRLVCRAEGQNGVFQTKALFVAERYGRGYRIFDVTGDSDPTLTRLSHPAHYFAVDQKSDPRYAGESLRSVNTLGGYVDYKLVRENPHTKTRKLVATTTYDKRSLSFRVVQGTADRIVYSTIHDNRVIDSEDVIKDTASNNTMKALHFDCVGKPVIGHIREDIFKVGEEHKELKVFQSKRRFTNRRGKVRHRDVEPFQQKYQGRALRPSKKNLQIMNVDSGKTVLQVGRFDDDNFAVDFVAPYTPFQAFGILLAQLDVN